MDVQGQLGVAMRPNKNINPGAHRSGTASGDQSGEPAVAPRDKEAEAPRQLYVPDSVRPASGPLVSTKYEGRQSVGPERLEDPSITVELKHEDWVDPLDREEARDLTDITIDLREEMRDDVPETYYQRFSSRVPGHKP